MLALVRYSVIFITFKNFMAPFYGWGSTASRLEPLWGGSLLFTISSQKSQVLILSTSEGWTAELTLEPPSGFEDGTLTHFTNVLQILTYYLTLFLNVFAIMPEKHCWNVKGRWQTFLVFKKKVISWACLLGSD